MSELISFKCPNCGSPLIYSAEQGQFVCEFCGSHFSFEEVKNADVNGDTAFDWGDYKENVSEESLEGTVSYSCKSCGAEVVADAVTAATHCPYCGNVIVMEENLSGFIKPNGVIPFRIDRARLMDIVQNYGKKRKLLPKNFFNRQKIEKIQGLYLPFWLYDCHADGIMGFDATRVRSWSDASYHYTETSHYYVSCDGSMDFARVPVDGSRRMDNALMDSVEPYDFSDLQPFAPGYLSGFVAERFDEDADACLPRASLRVKNSVASAFQSAITGYATLTPSRSHIQLQDTNVNYVLLPVYIVTAQYGGQNYVYAVNGQTGKIVGDLPSDKGKSIAYFLGISALTTAAALVLLTFLF